MDPFEFAFLVGILLLLIVIGVSAWVIWSALHQMDAPPRPRWQEPQWRDGTVGWKIWHDEHYGFRRWQRKRRENICERLL